MDGSARRVMAALAAALALGPAAAAAPPDLAPALRQLSAGWDRATYHIADRHAQGREAERLATDAAALARRHPGRAEPLAWEGLMLLVQADAAHNLSSLSLIGKARALLEQARRIDPAALGPGVIDANLGALYAQAPGRPLSFGDKRKARRLFAQAVADGPQELETNYLYGEFLLQSGDFAGAAAALERAIAAPARFSDQAAADRKAEAARLLARARAHER